MPQPWLPAFLLQRQEGWGIRGAISICAPKHDHWLWSSSKGQSSQISSTVDDGRGQEIRCPPMEVVGGWQHSMTCEAQTRFGWGGPGGRQSHRQTWSSLSNIRQQGVVLAICQAGDQELGSLEASGKSLEFSNEPQAKKSSRAGLRGQLKDCTAPGPAGTALEKVGPTRTKSSGSGSRGIHTFSNIGLTRAKKKSLKVTCCGQWGAQDVCEEQAVQVLCLGQKHLGWKAGQSKWHHEVHHQTRSSETGVQDLLHPQVAETLGKSLHSVR